MLSWKFELLQFGWCWLLGGFLVDTINHLINSIALAFLHVYVYVCVCTRDCVNVCVSTSAVQITIFPQLIVGMHVRARMVDTVNDYVVLCA